MIDRRLQNFRQIIRYTHMNMLRIEHQEARIVPGAQDANLKYMKIGLEYDNADTIKLGLYLEKNNAYGTMYIALDVHEYANVIDMMSNSSNNKLRLLYALGALSTLSSYSYDASIINIYKRSIRRNVKIFHS